MEKDNLIRARTCVYNVSYNIIWCVQYRKQVLIGGVAVRLKEIFSQIACEKDFLIQSMEVMPDYVQLLVSAHPKISPSQILRYLKGISGLMILKEFPDLRNELKKRHIWNSTFYVETIGNTSEESVNKYLEHQKIKG